MSATHRTCKTPNPKVRSLIVTVSEDSFVSIGGILPAEGTLYEDAAWKTLFAADYKKNFSEFAYVTQLEDTAKGGQLLFARSQTPEEKYTPFRTTFATKNHRWPMVVHGLEKLEDTSMGRSANSVNGPFPVVNIGPEYYLKQAITQECNEGTRFQLDEFFAATAFDIPQYPVPVPQSMHIILPGVTQTFPECLHPRIQIEDSTSTTGQIIAGAASAFGSALAGQLFPATNFKDWAPYVLEHDQKLQEGGWYSWRITVYPPAKPPNVIQ